MSDQLKEVVINNVRYVPEVEGSVEATVGALMDMEIDGKHRTFIELLDIARSGYVYAGLPARGRVRIYSVKNG
jgi:hypothetical protein